MGRARQSALANTICIDLYKLYIWDERRDEIEGLLRYTALEAAALPLQEPARSLAFRHRNKLPACLLQDNAREVAASRRLMRPSKATEQIKG